MTNLPSVTIGIPTYNRARMTCRAVRSVLAQDYGRPIEIIVADDGSTDDTVEVLGRFGSHIKLLRGKHGGIAAAKNRALLGGSGEIRGILDSDDFYERGFVRRCVDVLRRNAGIGVVYTDNFEVDARGKRTGIARALDAWSLPNLLDTCNVRGDCWLAWWNVLKQTKMHDERMEMEVDYDLFYQLALITGFRHIPEILHNVCRHGGRTTRNRQTAAYWHAAGLGKYGHSVEYAYKRANRCSANGALDGSIEEGYRHGLDLSLSKEPEVTCDVIIPVHNQPEYTVACLRSLASSTSAARCRVILIDNGSDQQSMEIVLPELAKLRHVLISMPTNLGFVKATNAGLEASSAPFILLLNNDTELPSDWFGKFLRVLSVERTVGIVGPLSSSDQQWQGQSRVLSWPPQPGRVGYRTLDWPDAMVAFFCAMMRREVFQQVGLLSERFGAGLGDDDDYCRRVMKAGWKLALRYDCTVKHAHRTTFDAVYGQERRKEMEAEAMETLGATA